MIHDGIRECFYQFNQDVPDDFQQDVFDEFSQDVFDEFSQDAPSDDVQYEVAVVVRNQSPAKEKRK